MHEAPVLLGSSTDSKILGDLKTGEICQSLLGLCFLSHADPGICDEDVCVLDCLFWHVGLGELECRIGALDDVAHERWDLVALWCGHAYFYAQLGSANGQIEQDIVGISDPCDFQALESQALLVPALALCAEGFYNGLEVGNGLEGVVEVRQRIDDRLAAVLGQVGHVVMRIDSGDNARHHAADDHGGVVERLIHSELDVVGAQEHGLAAEHGDRALGRHAGAGRPLGEHQGNCLGRQLALEVRGHHARLDARLVLRGVAHQRGQLLWSELADGEEVSRGEGGDGGAGGRAAHARGGLDGAESGGAEGSRGGRHLCCSRW